MSIHAKGAFAPDDTSAHLRQLSDEVARIAATLSSLSSPPPEVSIGIPPTSGQAPRACLDAVRSECRARRLRERFFDAELFADPAWDMLLELLQAELAQYRVSVTALCIAAHVPPTTALRWISALTDKGLLSRKPDPRDGRRTLIELTPGASEAMHRYFASISKSPEK